MKRAESELKEWGAAIKDEVNALMSKRVEGEAAENSKFRHFTVKFSSAMVKRIHVKTRMKWLDRCSRLDHVTVWKQIHRRGNTTLYQNAKEYRQWKSASRSTIIFVEGILGSGKSVLLANIIDDLHLSDTGRSIAYFFCRQANPETLKSREIIGCLVRQILEPVLKEDSLGDSASDIPRLDNDGILELVKRFVPATHTAFIVLDGADACSLEERHSLGRSLKILQQCFNLSLCVSFRADADKPALSKLDGLEPDLQMKMPRENPDIRDYVQMQLEMRIESGRLVLGDPGLALKIREKVINGANGMYVSLSLHMRKHGQHV